MEYPIPLQSVETSELVKAFSQAQGEFKGAKKETVNPFFKSHYADFASVWDAVRDSLSKYKLAVSQHIIPVGEKHYVVTVLRHESGQFLSSYYPIISQKPDAQGFGSGTTYSKRYSLQTLLCVASDDDDAEGAVDRNSHHGYQQQNRPSNGGEQAAHGIVKSSPTYAQIKRLYAICKASGWNKEDLVAHMQKVLGITSTKDLTWMQYENLCTAIQAIPKENSQDAV